MYDIVTNSSYGGYRNKQPESQRNKLFLIIAIDNKVASKTYFYKN